MPDGSVSSTRSVSTSLATLGGVRAGTLPRDFAETHALQSGVEPFGVHHHEHVRETLPFGPQELGFRAVVLDSEGNRIALHSETDA